MNSLMIEVWNKKKCATNKRVTHRNKKESMFQSSTCHAGAKGHSNKRNWSFVSVHRHAVHRHACAFLWATCGVYTTEAFSPPLVSDRFILLPVRSDKFHSVLTPTVAGDGDKASFPASMTPPLTPPSPSWGKKEGWYLVLSRKWP